METRFKIFCDELKGTFLEVRLNEIIIGDKNEEIVAILKSEDILGIS